MADGLNLDGTNLLVIDGSADTLAIDGGGAVITTTLKPPTQALDGTVIGIKAAIATTLRGLGVTATAPVFDATFDKANASGWVNGLSTTVGNLTKTGGSNRVMVMTISYEYTGTGSGHVTGITDSLGALTWSHYCTLNNPTSGAHNQTIEIWTAPAAAVYNPAGASFTQTVSWTGSNVDDASVTIFAVAGCYSITAPFDVNSPAFGIVTSSTVPPIVDFDTLQGGALVMAVTAQSTGDTAVWVTPSGWTNFDQAGTAAGINSEDVTIDYISETNPHVGSYHNENVSDLNSYTTIVLAFTGGPPLAPISQILDMTTGAAIPTATIKTTLPTLSQILAIEQGSIYLDGRALGGSNGPTNTATVTLTSKHADDVVILCVASGGFFHSAGVHVITDDAGLVWRLRHRRIVGGAQPFVEIWWAHAPAALTADVITVDTTGTTGAITIEALAIGGANYVTPWDTNMQAGWFTDNWGGNNPASNIVTNATETFLLAFYISPAAPETGAVAAPFTYLQTGSFVETSGNTMYLSTAYYIADNVQDNLATYFGQNGGGLPRALMCDAIVAAGQHGTDAQTGEWWFDGTGMNSILVFGADTSPPDVYDTDGLFTTFNSDIQIVVSIMLVSASGAGDVASVEAASWIGTNNFGTPTGLTWQRRSRVTLGNMALEIWWALSPTPLLNCSLQIATNNMTIDDTVSVQVYPVGGSSAFQNGPPWDIDRLLPSTSASDAFGESAAQISTILDNTLGLVFAVDLEAPLGTAAYSPFSMVLPQILGNFGNSSSGPSTSTTTEGPNTFLAMAFDFAPVPVSHETAEIFTSPAVQTWLTAGDAIPIGPRASSPDPAVITTTLPSINQRARAARVGAFSENVQVFVG